MAARLNLRQRRLQADYEQVKEAFTEHPYIEVKAVGGPPPERYEVTYKVKSILRLENNKPIIGDRHVVTLDLPYKYPRIAPYARIKTEIFHPNIGNINIDFGSRPWHPTEGIVDLILQIGELIQYKSYGIHSPMNRKAAEWTRANRDLFPIDNAVLS